MLDLQTIHYAPICFHTGLAQRYHTELSATRANEEENLTQSRLPPSFHSPLTGRPMPPFSHVGQGRKDAKGRQFNHR
jgi:hypothetical protein